MVSSSEEIEKEVVSSSKVSSSSETVSHLEQPVASTADAGDTEETYWTGVDDGVGGAGMSSLY